jgi:hypothetical protein
MPRTTVRIPDSIRAEVVRQYTTPLPSGAWKGSKLIAQELNISSVSVQNILRQNGVQVRTAKESHAHGKRCGPIKHTAQLEQPPLCACGCGTPTHWARSKYHWAKYCEGHYRTDAPYKSQAWLTEQYITLKRSVPDIANECGVNVATIIKFMKKFGIDRRDHKEAHIGTQAGALNPAWKGGTTPERQRLYKTQEWKALVSSVFARDAYTCQRCKIGTTGTRGDRQSCAHHIKSFAEHPDLRFDLANLITLCRSCHLWVHSLANVNHEYLG